jgi:hypothetical protein
MTMLINAVGEKLTREDEVFKGALDEGKRVLRGRETLKLLKEWKEE